MNCEPPSAVNASSSDDHGLDVRLLDELRERLRERRDVEPGPRLAGQPLQHVDRGEPPLRLGVVRGRRPDEERADAPGRRAGCPRGRRLSISSSCQPTISASAARLPGRSRAAPRAAPRAPSIGIRSCSSESRSRIVIVSSSSVCVVDRERPRRADLVLAAVALADRGRVVVLGRHRRGAAPRTAARALPTMPSSLPISGSTATFTGARRGWSRSTVRVSPPTSSSS